MAEAAKQRLPCRHFQESVSSIESGRHTNSPGRDRTEDIAFKVARVGRRRRARIIDEGYSSDVVTSQSKVLLYWRWLIQRQNSVNICKIWVRRRIVLNRQKYVVKAKALRSCAIIKCKKFTSRATSIHIIDLLGQIRHSHLLLASLLDHLCRTKAVSIC
jgi:hypothetical protein